MNICRAITDCGIIFLENEDGLSVVAVVPVIDGIKKNETIAKFITEAINEKIIRSSNGRTSHFG